MNYLLIGADRTTHLKIAALALVCSVLVAVGFNASLLAAPVSKPQLVDVTFAVHAENRSVCRVNDPSI